MIDLPPNSEIVETEVLCVVAQEIQNRLTAQFLLDGYTDFHEFTGYPEDTKLVIVRDDKGKLPPLAFKVRELPYNYEEACALF